MALVIDKEFAELIPALQPDERDTLEANLLAEGCRDPLVVWETEGVAVLLDGHNRYALCTKHDIPFKTVAAEVNSRDAALVWIVRNQLGKRNLRDVDRVLLALRLENALAEQAAKHKLANLKRGTETPEVQNSALREKTRDVIAKTAGVSHNTVDKVKHLAESSPVLLQAVRAGDMSIHRAHEISRVLETAPAPVVDFVTRTGLDDVDSVRLFAEGAKAGRDWWDDIQHTGYIQLGDEEEAVAWDAGALALKAAIEDKRKIHAQLAMDEKPDTPHVAHNSGNNEWYTPAHLLEAARCVMGGIDCDPATSEIAQRSVQASVYYTAETNGLEQPWKGRVWLNPPYAAELINQFIPHLVEQVKRGNVTQACVLVNNATETDWGQTLLGLSDAVCFLNKRVKFLDTSMTPVNTPLQGQMVVYVGQRGRDFARAFGDMGKVFSHAR